MTASVTVTERAAERIAQIVSNEPASIMLRVSASFKITNPNAACGCGTSF